MSKRASLSILVLLLGITFVTRVVFGLHVPLEADESTIAYAAVQIADGHLFLVDPNAHYLGATESYLLAPWMIFLGPGLLAVRLGMALVGVLYTLAMYGLGQAVFGSKRGGLLLAAVAAVFPLFVFTWDVKSRGGYAELLALAALLLMLCVRLGWTPTPRVRWWLLLGVVAGVALWNDLLILGVLVVIALALLLRAPVQGWAATMRGAATAAGVAGLCFSPWAIWQLSHNLAGLHALPKDQTTIAHSLAGLAHLEMPIFMGAASSCRTASTLRQAIDPWLAVALFGVIVVGAIWVRRNALRALFSRPSALQPVEMILLLAPVAILSVTFGRVNASACEPRYLLPLGIPLAVAASVVVLSLRAWYSRLLAAVTALSWLAVMAVVASMPTVDSIPQTTDGLLIPSNPQVVATRLLSHRLQAVFGDYWLMRPIQFVSGGRIPVGIARGPVGFPEEQRQVLASAHPSWLFVPGEPMRQRLLAVMQSRGITATLVHVDGLDLYANLSKPIHPSEVGGTDFGTDTYFH